MPVRLGNGPRMDMRTVLQGGVRMPVDTTRHPDDLFRRPSGTINEVTCLERRMQMENVCVDADPSDSSEQSCSMQRVNACIDWQKVQLPVPAKYLRILGGWANRHDVSQYRIVEIDRDRPGRLRGATDPRTGVAWVRSDCAGLTFCTFDEEAARNYANWITYYSTRLKASIAVTAQALSQIDADSPGLRPARLLPERLCPVAGLSVDPAAGVAVGPTASLRPSTSSAACGPS